VASLEGDNLVVFYYLSTSKIWPEKNSGLWWEEHYLKRGNCTGIHSKKSLKIFFVTIPN